MPAKKRLIICCDGTWQASDKPADDGGGNGKGIKDRIMNWKASAHGNVVSNVTNMCRALAKEAVVDGETIQQVVYYQSGIGTDVLTDLSAKFAGGMGAGLAENVVEAYNFLSLNFEAGDEIFLFGFSRGAYTVRSLAGLVSYMGVLKKTSIEHFPELYRHYKTDERERKRAAEGDPAAATAIAAGTSLKDHLERIQAEFEVHGYGTNGNTDHDLARIEIVGCWDTVGSLGIPDTALPGKKLRDWLNKEHAFHDPTISQCVKHAFHALAIDEHRRPFSPTLWHMPKGWSTDLVQCWFPGCHINIGGGNTDDLEAVPRGDLGQLADIAFAWMVDLCSDYLQFDDAFLARFREAHREKLRRPELPGWALGPFEDSFEQMALGGSLTRAPGQYEPTRNDIVPFRSPQWLEDDRLRTHVSNEWIHPAARVRLRHTNAQEWEQQPPLAWTSLTEQRALRHFRQVEALESREGVAGTRNNNPRHGGSGLMWIYPADDDGGDRLEIKEWRIRPGGLEQALLELDPGALEQVQHPEPVKLPCPPSEPGWLVDKVTAGWKIARYSVTGFFRW